MLRASWTFSGRRPPKLLSTSWPHSDWLRHRLLVVRLRQETDRQPLLVVGREVVEALVEDVEEPLAASILQPLHRHIHHHHHHQESRHHHPLHHPHLHHHPLHHHPLHHPLHRLQTQLARNRITSAAPLIHTFPRQNTGWTRFWYHTLPFPAVQILQSI